MVLFCFLSSSSLPPAAAVAAAADTDEVELARMDPAGGAQEAYTVWNKSRNIMVIAGGGRYTPNNIDMEGRGRTLPHPRAKEAVFRGCKSKQGATRGRLTSAAQTTSHALATDSDLFYTGAFEICARFRRIAPT